MRPRSPSIAALFLLLAVTLPLSAGKVKKPEVQDQPDGTKLLLLPDDVMDALNVNFPGYKVPEEKDFNPDMLQYYRSNLIGVHPAVCWGDFNGDRKRDYLLLVFTGTSKWGPVCELVALNGGRKGFDAFRLGEVYAYKDDYVSFADNKLYKGRYRKSGWYITWDKKKNQYVVSKG